MKENAIFRVRDRKGYGIVQQCGACEPLQSPTDVALERMICRTMLERPNRDSRNKDEEDKSPKTTNSHTRDDTRDLKVES